MTKKERSKLIKLVTIILIVTIIIIAIGVTVIYSTTDMLKSDKTLFFKYLEQNTENIETAMQMIDKDNLRNSKYEEKSTYDIEYTEKMGTTSENTNNAINGLKLVVEGQKDPEENYNYKNIDLQNNNNDEIKIEYLQQGDSYGIRIPELFNQLFLVVDNGDLGGFLTNIGLIQENNLPKDFLTTDTDVLGNLHFTDEEIQTLKNKYIQLVGANMPGANFTSQKNQTIKIEGKSVNVNKYVLTLTKEELNQIYVNILGALQEDEMILEKISNIQKIIDKTNVLFDKPIDLQEGFKTKINDMISEINKTNIGNEETKIIVCENYKKTVRTTIEGEDYQIDFDVLSADEEIASFAISKSGEEVQKILVKNNGGKSNISVDSKIKDEEYSFYVESNKEENTNGFIKKTSITYKKDNYKLIVNANREITQLSYIQKLAEMKENNTIKLNTLEEKVLNTVKQRVDEKAQQVKSDINMDDIQNFRYALGMAQDTSNLIPGENPTESEKSRFNAKFNFLNTEEEMDSKALLNAIDIFKDNLIGFEVPSNNQIKILINRNQNNEEYVENLKKYVENNRNKKFKVSLEYDGQTGFVKYVIIDIISAR